MENILIPEKAICELKEILKYLDPKLLNKIPEKLRSKIQSYDSLKYSFKIDKTKTLDEQNITKETRKIISALYLEYCCEPEEKQSLIEICKENDRKNFHYKTYEELFPKKEKPSTNKMELMVIEEKPIWYVKIWRKIKEFFRIKK